MSSPGGGFVARLWALCHVLRDDGITYHQYVEELALLLFLKMAKETGAEAQLPAGSRWDDLKAACTERQLPFYKTLLTRLGEVAERRVRDIFAGATTSLRGARHLAALIAAVDALPLTQTAIARGAPAAASDAAGRPEGMAELYEGLLEKNASELKSGAGQYFTPRPLVECIVRLLRPRRGERIQDPAAGTGGFLIYADRYMRAAEGVADPTRQAGAGPFELPFRDDDVVGGVVERLPHDVAVGRVDVRPDRLGLPDLATRVLVADVRLGDVLEVLNGLDRDRRGAGAASRPVRRGAARGRRHGHAALPQVHHRLELDR